MSMSILQVKLLEFFHRINEYIEYVNMHVLTPIIPFVRAYNSASMESYGNVYCKFRCR